jgi:hypothetical protein
MKWMLMACRDFTAQQLRSCLWVCILSGYNVDVGVVGKRGGWGLQGAVHQFRLSQQPGKVRCRLPFPVPLRPALSHQSQVLPAVSALLQLSRHSPPGSKSGEVFENGDRGPRTVDMFSTYDRPINPISPL